MVTASDASHSAIRPYGALRAGTLVLPAADTSAADGCAQATLCSKPSNRSDRRLVGVCMLFLIRGPAARVEGLRFRLFHHLQSVITRKVHTKIPGHDIVFP